MRPEARISIGERSVSLSDPTYFITDIASNHDGDLERAKALIWKSKEAGADAVKFQHFLAKDIVSDRGFRELGGQIAHQSAWSKSVYEVYQDYELRRDWTPILAETAAKARIEFMSTPYDAAAVELIDPLVRAYKIGSGDISWSQFLSLIAGRGKPVLLATGASDMADVERAVNAITAINPALVLMQCNTNYTGSLENFRYVNLRVLNTYRERFPQLVLGLSDHTPGHATVLGAVTMGARVVEKHFTDDTGRTGPDHAFSMTPVTWREMVDRTRELEASMGDGVKRVEDNERDAAVVQRRCIRLRQDVAAGTILKAEDLECLRPAPADALPPYKLQDVIGRRLAGAKQRGQVLTAKDVADA